MNFEKLKKAAYKAGIEEIEAYSVYNHGIEISSFNENIENNT